MENLSHDDLAADDILPEELRTRITVLVCTIALVLLTIVGALVAGAAYIVIRYERLPGIVLAIASGSASGAILFGVYFSALHWNSMSHHPRGWPLWVSTTSDSDRIHTPFSQSIPDALERVMAEVERARSLLNGPMIGQIRITRGYNLAAYTYENDAIVEVGVLAACFMDAEEFHAALLHEIAHLIETDARSKHEVELHCSTFLDFLRRRQHERELFWALSAQTELNAGAEAIGAFIFGRAFGLFVGVLTGIRRLAESMYFALAIPTAEGYMRDHARVSAEILRRCEFECDRIAANACGSELLARALLRQAVGNMGALRFLDAMSLTKNRHRVPGMFDLVRGVITKYERSAHASVENVIRKILCHESQTHPPIASRLEALGSSTRIEDLPQPSPLISMGELVEAWEWLSDNMQNLSEAETFAQQSERSLALQFHGCSADDLRTELMNADEELRRCVPGFEAFCAFEAASSSQP